MSDLIDLFIICLSPTKQTKNIRDKYTEPLKAQLKELKYEHIIKFVKKTL